MSHDHHHHHQQSIGRSLLWSTVLNFSVALFQLIGGIISNSLSLVSDAVHNLGDASAIFGAYIANKIGLRDPSASKTYGYKRAEIIVAFVNALVLITISVFLTIEAIHRFRSPESLDAGLMLWVAIVGLLANVASVVLLHKKREGNLNVKAAYLHLLSDTFSSVSVIIGAVAMLLWKIYWLDPILTIIVNVFILKHTYHVLKDSVDVLMQSVPKQIVLADIKSEIETNPAVLNAHHLHAWTMDGEKVYFDCHVEFKNDTLLSEAQNELETIKHQLKEKFHLHHMTFQAEFESKHSQQDLK